MKTDFEQSGKLYQKLDAYVILQRPESKGVEIYFGSSCEFKSQKKYKAWLLMQKDYKHLTFKIKKGE